MPVIVTNQGGPQENILPGETGVIVPANDPQALDEAVENLIADPLRLKRMGQAARQFLEDRSFKRPSRKPGRCIATRSIPEKVYWPRPSEAVNRRTPH